MTNLLAPVISPIVVLEREEEVAIDLNTKLGEEITMIVLEFEDEEDSDPILVQLPVSVRPRFHTVGDVVRFVQSQ